MSALLKFVRFKEFNLWDIKRHLSTLIYSDYEIVKLGNYIQEENNKIKPFEYPNDDFKILGVSNKVGLFDNEIKKGKDINQPYKKVEDGFLAYNPYRINVGSIGLKTDEQKNDLISPAYVVFSCNKELLPEYLFMIFKTKIFNTIINESTRGSVRQILAYDILDSLKIPLPPLAVQEKIVKDYQDKLDLSVLQEEQAKKKEIEIEEYLYKILGIKISKSNNKNLLNFVKFSNIERWDIQVNSFNLNDIKSSYEFIKVKKLIEKSQYGLSEKADLNSNNIPMLRMNNIKNGKLDITNLKYIDLNNKKFETYILNTNDIVFNRTNSKELVGKCAVFNLKQTYSFASYLIRLKLNLELINPNYFVTVLNSFIGRKQIDAISRQITGQVNVNVEELKNFVIPFPNLYIQNIIVDYVQNLQDEIKEFKNKSLENKSSALEKFEKEIFNEA